MDRKENPLSKQASLKVAAGMAVLADVRILREGPSPVGEPVRLLIALE